MDASNGLTCLCCQAMFENGNLQREHYKTDWHRYNLKRKITGFPTVTEEQFKQKVIAYRKETAAERNAETKMIICECCNKQFQSTNTYDNHLNSRKHKESETRSFKGDAMKRTKKVAVTEKQMNDLHYNHFSRVNIQENDGNDDDSDGWITDGGTEDENFDESEIIPETICLFCNYDSEDAEANLIHMSISHGFFLPDAEFCTDVCGMLYYLGLKVGGDNRCLVCNERKRFYSLDACQKHMRDKGHCRVACGVEEMIEFEEFYDYSSMYPEGEDISDKSYPIILTDDGYTLTLPSGAKIGHRSLLRYYKQRLKSVECESKSDRQKKEALKKAVLGQYKKLGWTGTSGTLTMQRAKDVRYMKINSKNWVKLGLNNSRLFKSRGRSDQ